MIPAELYKDRPRRGAFYDADELIDIKSMLDNHATLDEIADCLRRTKGGVLDKIFQSRLLLDAWYMPEAQTRVKIIQKFSRGRRDFRFFWAHKEKMESERNGNDKE